MIYDPPSINGIQKTLDAQLLSGITASMTLNNVTGIQDKPGVCVVDLIDANEKFTPAKREYISFTGVSGNTLTGLTRNADSGGSDQDHAVGAIVQFPADVLQQQALIDFIRVQHNDDGTHKSALVTTLKATGSVVNTGTSDVTIVTPKALADSTIAKVPASALDNVTGTDNTEFITPLANVPAFNSSLARQAIINGNFDVWQRGTSFAAPSGIYTADRWLLGQNLDGGTLPTISLSRQAVTPGDLYNSFYHFRLTTDGAGSSFGANAGYLITNKIEFGTRFLCGNGKKVTLSFWAKSDIANKKLGAHIRQNYGTGGSPTTAEIINGENWTLTSSWTKYTVTFTTNTLTGKTFGTANDDYIQLDFMPMWGTTLGSRVNSSGVAESFVGSGNIDIAQVQLCAGDVALPFMPKSFEEELRACQRYYEKSYDYAIAPGTASVNGEYVYAYNTGTTYKILSPRFKVNKRIAPTSVNIYDRDGTVSKITTLDSSLTPTNNVTITGVDQYSQVGFRIYHSTTAFGIQAHWTAEAEL